MKKKFVVAFYNQINNTLNIDFWEAENEIEAACLTLREEDPSRFETLEDVQDYADGADHTIAVKGI